MVGGGGVIGQDFVQICLRRFVPSVVCCVFSVFAYFPVMDILLDMPHAVPYDSDDDEGDDPFDEFHDLGDWGDLVYRHHYQKWAFTKLSL